MSWWRPRRRYKTGDTIPAGDGEVTLPLWVGLILDDGREADWDGYRRQPIPRLAREIFGHHYRTLDDLRWDVGGDCDIAALAIFDTEDTARARQVVDLVSPANTGLADTFDVLRGGMYLPDVIVNRWTVEDAAQSNGHAR